MWRNLAVCLVLVCLLPRPSQGADPGERERIFIRALELFDAAKSADDYRAAARELEALHSDGFRSGAVYYNLGNAWYRAGEYGRAILNYRKARPYRPRDPCLLANLQQALQSAPGRLQERSAPWWNHVFFWTDWISFPAKVQLSAAASTLAALLFVTAFLSRRSVFYPLTGVALTCAVVVACDALLNNPDSVHARLAVITSETIARKGTGKDYEPAFDQPLRDGAEFEVLSETADWTFGHFEGIGDGWIRKEFIAR